MQSKTDVSGHGGAPKAPCGEDLRRQVHAMWDSVADSWAEHADYVDARSAGTSEALMTDTGLAAGDRVLELAAGPGGLGIAAAQRVGSRGRVTISDVAPGMVAAALERVAARGLTNVGVAQLDLEDIHQPDDAFDVVLSREGLMFAVDPARALAEIRRVLRPGGRVGVAVWGPRARNPGMGLVLDAASAQMGRPLPPPGVPGPFALEDAVRLKALLDGAGFTEVTVRELSVPLKAPTFDEWWWRTSGLTGPLSKMLANLPPAASDELRARLETAAKPFWTAAGLEFPGVTLIASGRA